MSFHKSPLAKRLAIEILTRHGKDASGEVVAEYIDDIPDFRQHMTPDEVDDFTQEVWNWIDRAEVIIRFPSEEDIALSFTRSLY